MQEMQLRMKECRRTSACPMTLNPTTWLRSFFQHHLSKLTVSFGFLALVVLLPAKTSPRSEKTVIKGRIVAQAENNAEDFGSGSFLGSSQHYVFELENQ